MKGKSDRGFKYLLAALLIGETVISLHLSGNISNDLFGFAVGLVIGCGLAFLTKCIVGRKGRQNKLWTIFVLILSAVGFIFCAYSFSRYASEVMLCTDSLILPLISFSLLAFFAAKKGMGVLLKLGPLLFFVAAFFMLLAFGFSLPFIEVKYLSLYRLPTLSGLLETALRVGGRVYIALVPALFLEKDQKGKQLFGGFALGGGAILLCLVNTLGLFGAEFASRLSFPYSYAVSAATVGKIFSRMDPFLYCICFFTCLIKCSVCLYAALSAVKKLPFKILFQKK